MNDRSFFQNVDWMVDDLVAAVPDARSAVVLSADGLVVQKSLGISKDDADTMAAMASSLASVASAASDRFQGGPVRQTIVEMRDGYLVLTAAGHNARLVLLTGVDTDLGTLAYEMNRLIERARNHLGTATRGTSTSLNGSQRM